MAATETSDVVDKIENSKSIGNSIDGHHQDDRKGLEHTKISGKKRGAHEAQPVKTGSDDETFKKLAVEMIIAESKRAKVRAEQCGPSGWLPNKSGKPNKRFLSNLVVQAMKDRERKHIHSKKKKQFTNISDGDIKSDKASK